MTITQTKTAPLPDRGYLTAADLRAADCYTVDSQEGAAIVGRRATASSDYSGLVIPYYKPGESAVLLRRLRRNHPEIEIKGGERKTVGKYLSPPGMFGRSHFYLHPSTPAAWLTDASIPIVFVEGEFKAVALRKWYAGRNEQVLVIGLAGVSAWRGKIGRVPSDETPGVYVDEKGPIPDWEWIVWKDRQVSILFDTNIHTKDEVRAARAALTTEIKSRLAAPIYWLELPPDAPAEINGVDDYLGHPQYGPKALEQLIAEQIGSGVTAETNRRLNGRQEFYADQKQDIAALANRVWPAWYQAEKREPETFVYAGALARLQVDGDKAALEPLNANSLARRLRRVAGWYLTRPGDGSKPADADGKVRVAADVPQNLVSDLLATPTAEIRLPRVRRLAGAPYFTKAGRFVHRAGYDPDAEVYLTRDYALPPVPATPTAADVTNARAWLLELVTDFPFAEPTDRAHALALLLTPLVRDWIDGPTPAHVAMAPKAGTGKSLLVEVLLDLATGGVAHLLTAPTTEDEWRKQLLSVLRAARPAVLIDNVNTLRSPSLQAALTAREFSGRDLGVTRDITLPVNCVWAITGNNLTLDDDTARRCLVCYLDAGVDRPEARRPDEFKHPDLREWADRHRSQLLWACAVLVQHWLALGRPAPTWTANRTPKGSYESYSKILGGILDAAGIPGFLLCTEQNASVRLTSDEAPWRELVTEWWDLHGSTPQRSGDLLPIALEIPDLDLGRSDSRRGQATRLGALLLKHRNRTLLTTHETEAQLVKIIQIQNKNGDRAYKLEAKQLQ